MNAMSNRSLLLVILAAMFTSETPGQTPAVDSLRVTAAVDAVMRTHPAITQTIAAATAADARVAIAERGWYPMIGVEIGYTRLGPVSTIMFGPENLRLYPADNYDARVGVRQQLYDFGKTNAATDVGRSRARTARLGEQLLRSALAYQTIQVFYSILYLREAVAVQDEQINTLREHIEEAKKKVLAGTSTDFDVLTTEVRVASAENQRFDLVNAEHKQEIALARMMGRPGDETLVIGGGFEQLPAPANIDSLVTIAARRRPELVGAREEEQAAQLQTQVAHLADMPSLNLAAAYGLKNGFMPNLDAIRGNWAASVQLAIPIYESGRESRREEEADAMFHAASAHLADVQAQVEQEVRQSISDLRTASGKLSTSELQVHQAREALSIARKRYESGTISNLDLLDAETALQQANLLHLQALYGFTVSRYALDRSIGTVVWR